jgi:hypothetical protein
MNNLFKICCALLVLILMGAGGTYYYVSKQRAEIDQQRQIVNTWIDMFVSLRGFGAKLPPIKQEETKK